MSSGQPYDELGRILAEGGEISLGIAISHGYSPARIALLVARKMAGATQEQLAEVEKLARQAIDAAEKLNQMRGPDKIDPSIFPLNERLFGDNPDGRRAFVSIDFRINDLPGKYRLDVGLADIGTLDQLLEHAREEAERRIGASPKAFGVSSLKDVASFTWSVTVAERRF